MSNEHLKGFLIDDLKKLENEFDYIKENLINYQMNKKEIEHFEDFFLYWNYHLKNL